MAGRRVVIADYDPGWEELYRRAGQDVLEALGAAALEAHHIGSTSVPGLAAKPIIDILIELSRGVLEPAEIAGMEALGFAYRGEFGIAGRRYFTDTDWRHAHCLVPGSPEIQRHLDFRDYLRAHPHEVHAYGELKRGLAERFGADVLGYTDAKTDFIRRSVGPRSQGDWRFLAEGLAPV